MLTVLKWAGGIVAGLALLALLLQVSLFFRAFCARATGRIHKGEILIKFGHGPTDAIAWYTRHYLLGLLGVMVTVWVTLEPVLPGAWQVLPKTELVPIGLLVAAGVGTFWGAAMCVTHCGDLDVNLRRFGA